MQIPNIKFEELALCILDIYNAIAADVLLQKQLNDKYII